jgi:hypothetical protein
MQEGASRICAIWSKGSQNTDDDAGSSPALRGSPSIQCLQQAVTVALFSYSRSC